MKDIAYYKKSARQAEWKVQKQRDLIAYLQSQQRDTRSAHQVLNMLIKNQRWYEQKIERITSKCAFG